MSSDSTRWPDGGFAPGAVLRAREQWRRDAPPPTRPSRRAAAIRARPRRGGGCKILRRGAKFLIPATSGVGFVIAGGGSMMATCAAAGAPLGAPPWCYTVISGGSRSARFYWVLARSIGLAERVGFAPLLSDARACGGPTRRGLGTPRLPVGAAQPTSPIFSNDRFAPIPVARDLIGTPFHVSRESRNFLPGIFYFFSKSDSNLGERAEARACHVFATGLLLRDDPVAHLRPPPPRPISRGSAAPISA